jgi:hypothetical protein
MNAKLGIMLMVMGFMLMSLTAAVIYLSVKPRPVYYVPGATSAGIAYAQTDKKMTMAMFTASWVLNWSNFTPANVEAVYKHAQQFMSPRLLSQTRMRLKKDVEQIKRNNMSSLFSLSQDPQVQEQGRGFSVTIKGDKGVYMGKEEVKLQRMIYRIRLRQSPTTDWNPYGLIIEDISQEVDT